ncbi:MAG: hypothetical protein NZ740_04965 [Kiritimatiellae bacterium]|nr:hypothetical protein [Kiritimatiellia bacterium]MDW8458443.1 AsmA-like C-terminal region-containing protein [Verrucomicrobiota bacterium]
MLQIRPKKTKPHSQTTTSRRILGFIHAVLHGLWSLAVLLLAAFLFLWIVGVPSVVLNAALQRLETGATLAADGLRLTPRGELRLERLLVYPEGSFDQPFLRFDEISFSPDYRSLASGRFHLRSLRAEGGALFLPPFQASTESRLGRIEVNNIRISLARRTGDWQILAAASIGSMSLRVSGALRAETAEPTVGPRSWLASFAQLTSQTPKLGEGPRRVLEDILLTGTTEAQIEITGTFQEPEFFVQLISTPRTVGGFPVDRAEARLVRKNRRLALTSLDIRGPGGFHIQASRSDPSDDGAVIRGFFAFDRLTYQGAEFAQGSGQIELLDDGSMLASRCEVRLGATGQRGTALFDVVWQPDRNTLSGSFDLNFDPNDLAPLLTSNQIKIARRFAFSNSMPRFAGVFLRTARPTNLFIHGHLTASRFEYRGVPVDDMEVTLTYTNHWLILDNWRFTRGRGFTSGRMDIDLDGRQVIANLYSTMHPVDVAGLIGDQLRKAVSQWSFDGPTEMRAAGVVDTSARHDRTDLTLEARGERMGRGDWLADSASFTLHAWKGRYVVTNFAGRAFGGQLQGNVWVEPAYAGPEPRFIATISLTNADFAAIARGRSWAGETTTGRLHLAVTATGLISDVLGPATRGDGWLVIEQGELLRTPLFGGLSELLSRLVPGLGFVSQTDLECTFLIGDGGLRTDDLQLSGDVISMRARGDIEFDGRIRMDVQVVLMRRGPLAAFLRLLTFPVTKLFEFRLSGTLENPQWRPLNLPKELFLLFD